MANNAAGPDVEIAVRRLGAGDESALAGIVSRHKARTIDHAYAARLLENPLNFLAVAESGQAPLGFVWGYLLERLDRERHQLFIYEVDVLPGARGQGVGTALMRFVSAFVAGNDLLEAFVLADAANVAANALYRSTGGMQAPGPSVMYAYEGDAKA
jgi:ribosomal protein S18 acetylase RimI-like enzyme